MKHTIRKRTLLLETAAQVYISNFRILPNFLSCLHQWFSVVLLVLVVSFRDDTCVLWASFPVSLAPRSPVTTYCGLHQFSSSILLLKNYENHKKYKNRTTRTAWTREPRWLENHDEHHENHNNWRTTRTKITIRAKRTTRTARTREPQDRQEPRYKP